MGHFDRIVCAVDGSKAGDDALRLARRLQPLGGRLTSLTVFDPSLAAYAAWQAPGVLSQLQADARRAYERAQRSLADVPGAEARLGQGRPADAVSKLAREVGAALIVVGAHRGSRAAGILLGSTATQLIHDAPCPVLVARHVEAPESFPRSIVVGIDGSPSSLRAAELGRELAGRFGSSLRLVTAEGGDPLDLAPLASLPHVDWDARPAVDALCAASADADLVVVGSRGAHGFASLGSISERVAHRAASSVLVVRPYEYAVPEVATHPELALA